MIDNATRLIMGDNTDRVADLYAEPTYVLHPLQPDIPPLITHDDFRRHGAALLERMGRPDSHRAVDIVVHATIDPELVVTEFRYETTLNGVIMVTPCVWVTRVREGRVVEARDYNGEPRPSGPTPGTR
ncbi:nuclear transport factor 2 family protein [Amycolatopsis sp. NBC_01480]|uniref:nuclear transport factor 2 family protein n=1 Tax=Amycolatopsis sp. NBC_01480 TaxID=2903562 RepID=UPI002E2C621E|nr:nuclear transport factor 2 family protein [Amycolatopsis sp. NBC_01480]